MQTIKYSMIKNKNIKIIDVQDPYIYNTGHLPNSVNIPYETLITNYNNILKKTEQYYIYCKSGKLSKRTVAVLNSIGYNTIMVEL